MKRNIKLSDLSETGSSTKKKKEASSQKKRGEERIQNIIALYKNLICEQLKVDSPQANASPQLEEPDIASTLMAIDCLGSILDRFMKDTNYFVFDWALDNKSIELIDGLFTKVRKENHLLMISHDDYKPLRSLIYEIIQYPILEYQAFFSKISHILGIIANIDPEIQKIIRDEIKHRAIADNNIDPQTIAVFEKDFNKLINSSKEQAAVSIPPDNEPNAVKRVSFYETNRVNESHVKHTPLSSASLFSHPISQSNNTNSVAEKKDHHPS